MTTLLAAVPSICLATSAPRDVAIVNTVTRCVTAVQSQALTRPCLHEVSSMWAEAASRTCRRSSSSGVSNSAALTLQPGDHPQRDRQPQQVEHQSLNGPLPEAIGPDQDAEDRSQAGTERPGGHARRQGPAGTFAAPGASEPVELILIDLGAHRGQFGHLVAERFGIHPVEVVATTPALRRLAHDDLAQLFRRHQGTDTTAVTGLPSPSLPRGRSRRARFTDGASEDGGFDELVELVLSRSSRAAIRCSKEVTSADTAACASGERVPQISSGSGGRSVMTPL